MKILPIKKTRNFNGKTYHWQRYVSMKSQANDIVRQLRNQGKSVRVVAQPGYGQAGWDIYIR